MKLQRIKVSSKSNMTGVFIRRGTFGHRDTDTQRRDGHVEMEAENKVILPQAKDAGNHQKLGQEKKGSL